MNKQNIERFEQVGILLWTCPDADIAVPSRATTESLKDENILETELKFQKKNPKPNTSADSTKNRRLVFRAMRRPPFAWRDCDPEQVHWRVSTCSSWL